MLVTMPSWSAGVSLSFHAVVDRQALLSAVYGPDSGAQVAGRLDELVDAFADVGRKRTGWTEADAWMIAYPDQFSDPGQAPLEVLGKLLDEWRWLTGVHILPCYPWSSDDGFSVKDYEQIEPSYGTVVAGWVLFGMHFVGLFVALPLAWVFSRFFLKIKRLALNQTFENLPRCIVGMEACLSAHLSAEPCGVLVSSLGSFQRSM